MQNWHDNLTYVRMGDVAINTERFGAQAAANPLFTVGRWLRVINGRGTSPRLELTEWLEGQSPVDRVEDAWQGLQKRGLAV